MKWKTRIAEIAVAGGLMVGAAGCGEGTTKIPACNANPDPCCSDPAGAACTQAKEQEQQCAAAGGSYNLVTHTCTLPDGGTIS